MFKDSFYKNITVTANNRHVKTLFLSLGTVLLFLLGQILGSLFLVLGMIAIGFSEQEIKELVRGNVFVKFLSIALVQIFTISLLYSVYRQLKKSFLKGVRLNEKFKLKFFGYAIISYILYLAFFVILVSIFRASVPAIDTNQSQQLGFGSPKGVELLFVYLSLVILPAVAEEVLFRGFLFQRLKRFISLRMATIVTSLIFGALHLEFIGDGPLNWIAAIDTFVLSVFLIGLLEQTKSLWSSIVLHAIKNSVAFVGLFILKN